MSNSSPAASTWKSQAGFVWSLIGSAVGFANVLSFSAQVYKNGGGAFLIPYILALLMLGVPMLILEGLIGNRWKQPIVGAYAKKWGPTGQIFGWLSVIACLTIGAFYIVLTGYSAAYTYLAASSSIPDDSQNFFLNNFLHITSGLGNFGQISYPILFATLGVSLLAWTILVRQVKDGIERICSFFMPLLAIIIGIFAIAVCFLPGGMNGWTYYLTPHFEKLGDPALWRDVFGQLFFSLSLGLGIIVGYSRHTKKETNIVHAMMWVALGDFIVSFVAGFAIFGCLAHISFVEGVPFESILTTDSSFEIGFILFPKIFKFFGSLSTIIGTIFFFCVFIAGITGVFSIVESIAGNVEVEFKTTRYRAVTCVMACMIAMACFFCMGNASHFIDALAPMLLGTNMLIGGLALILAFVYRQSNQVEDCLWNKNDRKFYVLCLRYFAPVILTVILALNLIDEFQSFDLAKAVRWSWFGCAFCISSLITYILHLRQMRMLKFSNN
jgi:NSS family neurotransmitter:Na+ symporter